MASPLIRQMKTLCPSQLKQRIKLACGVPDAGACLAAMKGRGFNPKVAIDVGAYSGEWTVAFRRLFPKTRVLMIEPQPAKKEQLLALASTRQGVEFVPVLLGASMASGVTFYEDDTGSSILPDPGNGNVRTSTLTMTTLAAVTRGTDFERPDFLKLDVQGYEIEVLKGAERLLDSVEAIMMEVNVIAIYQGTPLVHDAVSYMAALGFRVYDICSFFRRPHDNALWQMDMIFVKATSPLVASTRWA